VSDQYILHADQSDGAAQSVVIRSCEEHFASRDIEAWLVRNNVTGGAGASRYGEALLDLGEKRLAAMDAAGIDMQILSLVTPGVQDLPISDALALARVSNDELAETIREHPDRYAGIAVAPPQQPDAAASELDRAVTRLGLRGLVIHSHTRGEYLDDQKFWPLLEAAESLDVPIYLHPRGPSQQLAGPALDIPGLRVGWSFAIETGTHALRMISAGVFDRYPKLKIVLGHMGELLPFAIPRIDARFAAESRHAQFPRPRGLPGEYLKSNFLITTSGMNYWPQLRMTIQVMGIENVLFAADYPFEDQGEAVSAIRDMPLSASQRHLLCDANARRVFLSGGSGVQLSAAAPLKS